MMKDALAVVRDDMPKMNPVITEGIAYWQMKNAKHDVDKLLCIAFRSETAWTGEGLPTGFQYLHMDSVTPEEEYIERCRRYKQARGKRRGYNMAQTDTFMVKAVFENDGEVFGKYISIPFARRGGIMYIMGTKYGIPAVLKTKGLSETNQGYFTEFPRHRVKFEKTDECFLIDGNTHHVYMPYSTTLHSKAKRAKSFVPPLACWLFAKFGLKETFRKFLGIDVELWDAADPELTKLDPNKYAVCKAVPPARGAPPQIAIVVKKNDITPVVKIFIGTVFYVAKVFPTRVVAEYADNAEQWKILLGYSIFGVGKVHSEVRLPEEIRTHFSNLERMMDTAFKKELLGEGVECDTIYEYLFFVIESMTARTGGETSEMANLYGRYYTSTEYVLRDLREAIFSAHYALVKLARKSNGRPLQTQSIKLELNKHIRHEAVTGINSGHGEITPFMTASDNMLIGLTSHAIDQTDARKGNGKGGKRGIDLTDPAKHQHSSFVEAGSVGNLPKSKPYGPYRINPYVNTDHTGRIVRKVHLIDKTDALQIVLRSKGV